MGHYEKLYGRIKNNMRDVYFDDLDKLLTKCGGFEGRQGKGDHYIYCHPDLVEQFSVDTRGKHEALKKIYVKRLMAAFDQVNPGFKGEDMNEN